MAMQYATFELEFTINHPFAYETAQQLQFTDVIPGTPVSLTTEGTVSTPIRLVIKNRGDSTVINWNGRQLCFYSPKKNIFKEPHLVNLPSASHPHSTDVIQI